MNIINSIIKLDRRLRIGYNKILTKNSDQHKFIEIITNYLDDFSKYHGLTAETIVQIYDKFLLEYTNDVKDFIKTGKYPFENNKLTNLKRLDYDIALILSVLTTQHRFKILKLFKDSCYYTKGNVAIIGLGSGLELEILGHYGQSKDNFPYDIEMSGFVKEKFRNIKLYEREFSREKIKFSTIYAIELLEHLYNPFVFIENCINCLNKNGSFFTTTASNIPQSDHLYNFVSASDFKRNLTLSGLSINFSENILHETFSENFTPYNDWYHLIKN